jgi:hypothetical protein
MSLHSVLSFCLHKKNISKLSKDLEKDSLNFIPFCQETLHFHNDDKVESIDELEAQTGDSKLEAANAKQSRGESTKSLLKNWQLMSAVILYCIFSLHDTAYLEVCYILFSTSAIKINRRHFHPGP